MGEHTTYILGNLKGPSGDDGTIKSIPTFKFLNGKLVVMYKSIEEYESDNESNQEE